MTADAAVIGSKKIDKPYLPLERGWWRLPLIYMLSLSLVGLHLYPVIGISIIILAYSWQHDRYDFLIMLSMLFFGYGLYDPGALPIKLTDIALITSAALWFMMRKPPILKRTLTALLLYFGFMLIIAMLSVESIKIQIMMMRFYWMIIYIIVPIAVFSGQRFDFDTFIAKLMPYALIMGIFYLLDAYIISGHMLVPTDTLKNDSTFYDPVMHPFSGKIYRIYPTGIFFYSLMFLPIIRNYRLKWWQWMILAGALIASQTFTIMASFLVIYIIFQGTFKKIILWGIGGIVFLTGAYFIDGFLPEKVYEDSVQSRLRIKSSIDQFIDLYDAVDEEDIAKFGSNRMAQVIPKLEVVDKENREWIGLGFLHPEKTTLNQYIITNNLYSDIEQAEEVSTAVEISQVQVYLNMGWLGLIVVTLTYFYLFWLIRKLPLATYFLSILGFDFIWGLAGFIGINFPEGCQIIALAYAAVILSAREELPGFNCNWPKRRSIQ